MREEHRLAVARLGEFHKRMQEKLQAKYQEDEARLAGENSQIKAKIRDMEVLMENMHSATAKEKEALEGALSQVKSQVHAVSAEKERQLQSERDAKRDEMDQLATKLALLEASHSSAMASHAETLEATRKEYDEALETAKREANPFRIEEPFGVQCPQS